MNKSAKNDNWRGYDFDQLVYQRVRTQARIEAQKTRLADTARSIKNENKLISMRNARMLFGTLSFIDYTVLAIKIYRRIKPIFSEK